LALVVGTGLALALLVGVRRRERALWRGFLNDGLASAAPIVLLTGMGGGLGTILRDTGMIDAVSTSSPAWELGLGLAVLVASTLKIAQGSGTVAITVGASIMAPLMESAGLDDAHHRALTVTALGAGSLMVSHVNDSYFWVFTRLLACPLKRGLQLLTPVTALLGMSSAAVVWLLSLQPTVVGPTLAVGLAGLAPLAACISNRSRSGHCSCFGTTSGRTRQQQASAASTVEVSSIASLDARARVHYDLQ